MQKIKFGIGVFFCGLAMSLFLSACIKDGGVEEIEGADLQEGDVLPAFSVTLSDGTKITDTSFDNKVSLVFFFSTSCPDCMKQFPDVDKIYNELKGEEDFVFCAVSRSDTKNEVQGYWTDHQFTMPYSIEDKGYNLHIYSLFASRTIPRIYIADKNKVIRKMYTDNPIAEYADMITQIKDMLNINSSSKIHH